MKKETKEKILRKKVFSGVFSKDLKVGMFVKFWNGKIIYRVSKTYDLKRPFYLRNLGGSGGPDKFLDKVSQKRVHEIPNLEAFIYILKYRPEAIHTFFSYATLREFADLLSTHLQKDE